MNSASYQGVAAIVLAAGRSSRMGAQDKLLATLAGVPMIRRVVEAVVASEVCRTVVVTGAAAEGVTAQLTDTAVTPVHNPHYADGLASSLRVGLAEVGASCEGVLIVLGDMPFVSTGLIDRVVAAFEPGARQDIVVPETGGRIGNPVLFAGHYAPELMQLTGDRGARALLEARPERVLRVEVEDEAIFFDIDTPEALERANRQLGWPA